MTFRRYFYQFPLLFLLFWAISSPGHAQDSFWMSSGLKPGPVSSKMAESPSALRVYGGLGFNQSLVWVDSLNFVIDRYNATHDTDRELMPINAPRGLAVQLGILGNRFMLDLGFTGRGQTRRSREAAQQDGTYNVRELRYRANTFDVGFGLRLNQSDNWMLMAGASLDFGSVRILTRYGRNDSYRNTPINGAIVNELTLANTVFLQAAFPLAQDFPIHLFIRPYFQYDWYQNDFGPVNRALNFQTYLDDPQFILSASPNLGLKVGVVLISP